MFRKLIRLFNPNKVFYSTKRGTLTVDWGNVEVTKSNALELAIQSWIYTARNAWRVKSRGGSQCALCLVYKCFECPVTKVAEKPRCHRTPYEKWADVQTTEYKRKYAWEEVHFLEGLRE